VLILVASRVDQMTRWGETVWIHPLGGNDVGVAVGLLPIGVPTGVPTGVSTGVPIDEPTTEGAFPCWTRLLQGRRSCTVGAVGLAIVRVRTVCRGGGSSICLMKGLKGALLRWLLAWTVMSSAISLSSSSGVSSSKITNGLLLRVCC
jgi:hypothetical protein